MQQDFLVESRSYNQGIRGSWRTYKLDEGLRLGNEEVSETADDAVRLWLPAGTPMRWATGTRPLRNNCLQIFWPQRWYMLSAFYNNRMLMHTYAMVIQPAAIQLDRLSYTDLDLSVLVKPNLSYEVLTQARIGALMALRALTSTVQRSIGIFASVPSELRQTDFHLAHCGD
jgi:hypothetical protein